MGIAARIRAANTLDRSRFLPFRCDGHTIGWIRRDFVPMLQVHRDVFACADGEIVLAVGAQVSGARSEAMAHVAAALAARGLLTAWRGETYDIRASERGVPLFRLERAAVRFFGLVSEAVHVNGLSRVNGAPCMWIARRSRDKAIDPDMFDNVIGGGVASGVGVRRTLIKEAWEEAGIDADLAGQARCAGRLSVAREVPDGLHVEVLHVFDLELPDGVVPVNQDREVAGFRALGLPAVAAELEGESPYTVDAALVAIDCLRRAGVPLSSRG